MISNRLLQIIKNEGLSVRSFEEKINVSQSTISKTINNGKDVSGNILKKTLEIFPHYNAEWLVTGKGEMLKNNVVSGIVMEPLANYKNKNDDLTNKMLLDKIIELSEELGYLKKSTKIKQE
jgi:transcriptional regulator with XRE-family HTH domain